ncbi:hypothetical protein NT6N_21510 [Oceaniferula spumae]|uniref:Uncharacterized protein n=1 Tax=Oceaniferula spumae TaxID=2979115 RepID=A0AAT9FMG3_9BACT
MKLIKPLATVATIAAGYFAYPFLFQTSSAEVKAMPTPDLSGEGIPTVYSGGTVKPIQDIFAKPEDIPAPAPDEAGRMWTFRTYPAMKTPLSMSDHSFFVVLRPDKAERSARGVFGRKALTDTQLLIIDQFPDGAMVFKTQDGGRRVDQFRAPGDKLPKIGSPRLLETHPVGDGKMVVLVDGVELGTLKADVMASFLGGSINRHHFQGHFGHVSAHKDMTAEERAHWGHFLRSWWAVGNGDAGAFPVGFRLQPGMASEVVRVARTRGLDVVTEGMKAGEYLMVSSSPKATAESPGSKHLSERGFYVSNKSGAKAVLSFVTEEVLPQEMLGESGHYELLFSAMDGADWTVVGKGLPTEDGRVNFAPETLATGVYTLAAVGGVPVKASGAELLVKVGEKVLEKKSVDAGGPFRAGMTGVRLEPGDWYRLEVKGAG